MLNAAGSVTAIRYHEATKHHPYRYAKSLGYLDWDNQPNPFRFYEGALQIKLPFANQDPAVSCMGLYERSLNPVREFSEKTISLFLELSLGLSAWKSIEGAKWALRMNPSSGNLHPTEGYLIFKTPEAFPPGVYHYNSYLHALETRASFAEALSAPLAQAFPVNGFFFALTSIHWRESWKYGERAFRYCHHDIGHAIAAASFAANLLGWKISFLHESSDEDIAGLLGIHKDHTVSGEEEFPDVLAFIHPATETEIPSAIPEKILHDLSAIPFQGRANTLSQEHVDWEIIQEAAHAAQKKREPVERPKDFKTPFFENVPSPLTAPQIIRQRRSFQACDGMTGISKTDFFSMLDKTLPRENAAPFDFALGPARVHLFLFVHRVTDLAPGLYMLLRNEEDLVPLKQACSSRFLWRQLEEPFPLYLLAEGKYTQDASAVSCQQAIAGDGAFSLGMIAKFREPVERQAFIYRHLFWECGMIGQVLYLEAEAKGIRGTGIGCFFDDSVHHLIGLKDHEFQSLYHFTVGKPVEDTRLQTWPPYFHLKG